MTLIETTHPTDTPSVTPATVRPPADPPATAVTGMSVLRRDGSIADFDPGRISVAITKAFLAVEGETAGRSSRLRALVVELTDAVVGTLRRRYGPEHAPGRPVDLEDVQDQVELALMRDGHAAVARAYILYREEHRRARAERAAGPAARDRERKRRRRESRPSPSSTRAGSGARWTCRGSARSSTRPAMGSRASMPRAVLAATEDNLYDGISVRELGLAPTWPPGRWSRPSPATPGWPRGCWPTRSARRR